MLQHFKCPKCGGFHFGAFLNDRLEIVSYACHNATDGRPLYPFIEAYVKGIRQKECGWKGKPAEVAWVDEIPDDWPKSIDELGE